MKKLFLFAIVSVLVSGVLTSCKSHEKCPAYSKVENKANANI